MRTVIDIPEADIPLLDQLSEAQHMSREEFVGATLSAYLHAQHLREEAKQDRNRVIDEAFGSWANFPEDGLAYQERIRSEWER